MKNYTDLIKFYEDYLKITLLPFWLKNGIDKEFGGYYTCFNNSGSELISTDKYTWSQGRMVWIFSKLSTMKCFTELERKNYLELAKSGVKFLMNNCFLENGNCTFVMTREGTPKPQNPDSDLDSSIFADCFVILGLARYAAVAKDNDVFNFIKKVYNSVIKNLDSGNYKSQPYPKIEGTKTPTMIEITLSQEIAHAMRKFGDQGAQIIEDKATGYMRNTMNNFVDTNNLRHEIMSADGKDITDTLLGRYINPGHSIEDLWFITHQALISNTLFNNNNQLLNNIAAILDKTIEIGWDKEFGGLQLFADQDGGRPKGSIKGVENEVMVSKVTNDWDSKLWWPHSEALYTIILVYNLTGEDRFMDHYQRIFKYALKTFPNPDKSIGEWIQIRDRKGNPENKVVALPVKDPFHIIRNFILVWDLLNGISEGKSVKDIIES